MRRTFKQFTIQAGGTPQPLVGTTVSATTAPPNPGLDGLTTVPVVDSSMFQGGDWAFFIDAALTASKAERVLVQSVKDSTHIVVKGLTQTRTGGVFGTGDFVALAMAVNSVYVQCKKGNTGSVFIGTQGLNKTGYVHVIAELLPFVAATQPIDYSDTRAYGPDADQSSDLWVDGTTGDGYLPSYGVA